MIGHTECSEGIQKVMVDLEAKMALANVCALSSAIPSHLRKVKDQAGEKEMPLCTSSVP